MRPSLDEARRLLLAGAGCLPAEAVPLAEAAGRIAQEAVAARITLPGTDCAAVDGYAVRVADLPGSDAGSLRLAGTVSAGEIHPPPLPPGHCLAVMTGAPLPAGSEAVIPLEAVRREGEGILVAAAPVAGSGIRRAGEEARAGEILVPRGAALDPRALERLAAQGMPTVSVPRRARVHLVAVGDELAPPGEVPAAGRRLASNLPMLAALVRACGGIAERSGVVPDDPDRIRQALAAASAADLVLTTGGTMRGAKDFVKTVLAGLGARFLFQGVAMRPGASCAAAGIGGTATILCLPGSPGAAFLAFLALGRPLLRALHGWEQPVPALTARLAEPLEPAPEEARLVAGVLCEGPAGPGFRRGGQGWPALGILAPAATGGGRDGRISVEPLPQE